MSQVPRCNGCSGTLRFKSCRLQVFSLVLRVSEGRPWGSRGALRDAAWLIQFGIAVVLPQALLLHGEAGPVTSAFQPEQPAHLLLRSSPAMRKGRTALGSDITSVSGQTRRPILPRSAPYACAYLTLNRTLAPSLYRRSVPCAPEYGNRYRFEYPS